MTDSYCYSLNEQWFDGDFVAREDAYEEALERAQEQDVPHFWTARVGKRRPFSEFASAQWLVDHANDSAYSEAPDEVRDRDSFEVSKEAVADLDRVIEEWAKRHDVRTHWWNVEDVKEHSVADALAEKETRR